MSTAFAATDFITSGARSKTQDPMVLDAENEEGLSGRDLALARFRNKLRFGRGCINRWWFCTYGWTTSKNCNCWCKVWFV